MRSGKTVFASNTLASDPYQRKPFRWPLSPTAPHFLMLSEIGQVDSLGIIGTLGAARVAQAVVLALEVEAMRVLVLPAHHHLKDMM